MKIGARHENSDLTDPSEMTQTVDGSDRALVVSSPPPPARSVGDGESSRPVEMEQPPPPNKRRRVQQSPHPAPGCEASEPVHLPHLSLRHGSSLSLMASVASFLNASSEFNPG